MDVLSAIFLASASPTTSLSTPRARDSGVSEALVQMPLRSGLPSAVFGTCASAAPAVMATASAAIETVSNRIVVLLWGGAPLPDALLLTLRIAR